MFSNHVIGDYMGDGNVKISKAIGIEMAIIILLVGIVVGYLVGKVYGVEDKWKPDMKKIEDGINTVMEFQKNIGNVESINAHLVNVEPVTAAVVNITLKDNTGTERGFNMTWYFSKDYNFITPFDPRTSFNVNATKEIIKMSKNITGKLKPLPKKEKPEIKLFVMSQCPYGTMAEKGLIPVLELLKDKVVFKPEFVSYTLHGPGEVRDNTIQYCVNKLYPDKYIDYLKCYLADGSGPKAGNTTKCLNNVSIPVEKIETCINDTYKEFGIDENKSAYPIYSEDNKKYGVMGSPTLVINDVVVKESTETPGMPTKPTYFEIDGEKVYPGKRSPETYKKIICSAFDKPPEECNVTLTDTTPAPGFGMNNVANTQGNTPAASCGV